MSHVTERALIPALILAFSAGCFYYDGPTFERDPGPGPSDDIDVSADPEGEAFTTQVTCEGPEEELAILGSLCGFEGSSLSWNAHVGDQSVYLGDPNSGDPVLLILGFYTEELPAGENDHTFDIRYAAYLVFDPPAESTRELMRSWTEGEALSGSISTRRAVNSACTYNFAGSGTLYWRDTTIRIAWSAALGC